MKKFNLLLLGDSAYVMDNEYREGAQAMRRQVPWSANPYRRGSAKHDSWDLGHVNESAKAHIRFGRDLLAVPLQGETFREDASVPLNEVGEPTRDWYNAQLVALTAQPEGELALAA